MTQPLRSACRALSQLWDTVVEEFFAGGTVPPYLEGWAKSYQGKAKGAVQWEALPEPFLGPLTKPRGVFLALNPGQADLGFQGRKGIFAGEIGEKYGSYSAWAASWPYLRDPWIFENGENRHHRTRLRFLRDWIDDQELPCGAMVSFELYPWHSARFTGRLDDEAAQEYIREFIWEPVAELGAPVFAFGARWFPILKRVPGLEVVKKLGADGEPYGGRIDSRSVIVLQGCGGITVIAEKHLGSAGPPSSEETKWLRDALGDYCR